MAGLNAFAQQGQKAGAPPAVSASQYVSVSQIEQIMEIPAGSMSSLAWLVLNEQAKDVSIESIAENLGVSPGDVLALVDNTTGKIGDDSKNIWLKGIVALRAVAIVNQQNIGSGWDAIEAIAVDKAAQTLSAMRGPQDLDRMIQIASTANKAIRRTRGETSPGSGRAPGSGVVPEGGLAVELRSGNLGTITLSLAPAVRAQLANPTRVIDMAKKAEQATRTQNLEMLTLQDTRALADESQTPSPDAMEIGGMTFDIPE